MHTYNDILRNTLESMAADAEDKGKENFGITLDLDDAKILIDGLKRLEPAAMEDCSKIVPIDSPLSDTVEGMLHPDYKERFKAEYKQTKIRYEKLKAFNTKIEASYRTGGNVDLPCKPTPCVERGCKVVEMPKHDCPEDLLREQQRVMGEYLHILETRAVIEGISLG